MVKWVDDSFPYRIIINYRIAWAFIFFLHILEVSSRVTINCLDQKLNSGFFFGELGVYFLNPLIISTDLYSGTGIVLK